MISDYLKEHIKTYRDFGDMVEKNTRIHSLYVFEDGKVSIYEYDDKDATD